MSTEPGASAIAAGQTPTESAQQGGVGDASAQTEGDAAGRPLAARARTGAIATLGAHVASNAIRLISNLILTRLLAPEHFGTMALVSVVLQGLHMFSDLGVGTSLVQHADGERPEFVRTAFTIQALRGVWLCLGALICAWPMAQIYDLPELIWMVPFAGATGLIEGFSSTKIFRENRHLRLGVVSLIEIACQLAGAIAMVCVAWSTRSVLALLMGSIVSAGVRVTLSHTLLPGFADGFAWDDKARKELLNFGRWVFVSTAITFIAMQLDRLMLGKLVQADLLGIYTVAVMLAAVPREVLGQLLARVLYPMVAELVRQNADPRRIRSMRIRILASMVVPLGVLAGESTTLFGLMYDERYQLGGPLMAFLCLGTWFNVVGTSYGVVVLSKGWPKWISFGTGIKVLVIAVCMVPVHSFWGLPGVALLIGCAEAVVAVCTFLGCRGVGVTTPQLDIGLSFVMVAIAVGVHFAQQSLNNLSGSILLGLAIFGGAATAAFAASTWTLVNQRRATTIAL